MSRDWHLIPAFIGIKLQRAQGAYPTRSTAISPTMATYSGESISQIAEEAGDRGAGEDDNDTVVNPIPLIQEPKTPRSPDLRPVVPLEAPSPFSMTPRVPSTPLLRPKPLLAVLKAAEPPRPPLQEENADQKVGEEEGTGEGNRPSAIALFDQQVRQLGAEIDAFKIQREYASELIEKEQKVKCSSTRPSVWNE